MRSGGLLVQADTKVAGVLVVGEAVWWSSLTLQYPGPFCYWTAEDPIVRLAFFLQC